MRVFALCAIAVVLSSLLQSEKPRVSRARLYFSANDEPVRDNGGLFRELSPFAREREGERSRKPRAREKRARSDRDTSQNRDFQINRSRELREIAKIDGPPLNSSGATIKISRGGRVGRTGEEKRKGNSSLPHCLRCKARLRSSLHQFHGATHG